MRRPACEPPSLKRDCNSIDKSVMFEFHLRSSRTSRKSRRRREVRRRDDAGTMFDHTQYGSAADSGAKLLIANWEHTQCQVSSSAAISHQLKRGMHRRKRAIYARSKYQCEYHSSTSRRCAALLMLAGSWTGRRANANIRHSWDAEDMQRDHAIGQRPVDGESTILLWMD